MRSNRQALKSHPVDGQGAASNPVYDVSISEADYLTLTAWRDTLRAFLNASKTILKQVNVTPNQYQALLCIRFGNGHKHPTIGQLASCMHIRHNSGVTLVNKLVERGWVKRVPSHEDRRLVHLHLTAKGEATLRKMVTAHRHELNSIAPALRKILP